MRSRRANGLVLMTVLFFVLLAASGIATFQRQASVDGLAVRNRDLAARSEALARGGVRLAIALLLQDRLDEARENLRVESLQDLWLRSGPVAFELPDGGRLRVDIEDAGARLDLNALFQEGRVRDAAAEVFLVALLRKVVDEMPGRPEEKLYDTEALAQNLIDYIDADSVRTSGGREDEPYETRPWPDRAANRPLLSMDELARVEGFDARLVQALRPYVAVQPLSGGDGINPNTAPPWVLAEIFHGTGGAYRLASEDTVRRILDIRERGGILCADDASHPACTPLREAVEGTLYPPPTFSTEVFRIRSEARYGKVRRRVEAVVDRSQVTAPAILAWKVR